MTCWDMAKGLESVQMWQEVIPPAILAAVLKDAQHLTESPNFWIPEVSRAAQSSCLGIQLFDCISALAHVAVKVCC